jgi:hypothetical protein
MSFRNKETWEQRRKRELESIEFDITQLENEIEKMKKKEVKKNA